MLFSNFPTDQGYSIRDIQIVVNIVAIFVYNACVVSKELLFHTPTHQVAYFEVNMS